MTGPKIDPRGVELARLQGGLGDLTGLLALSATWSGRSQPEIARTLAEALNAMLPLDLVFVSLHEQPVAAFAIARDGAEARDAAAVGSELRRLLGEDLGAWPSIARGSLFDNYRSIASVPIGLESGFGVIVVAAERTDFPDNQERLLLNIARNQALLALQEARWRREESIRASESSAVALIEGLPGLVAVLGPDGRVERINRQIEEYCGQTLEELRDWGVNGTVHPEDLPHVGQVFGRSIASGTPYKIEQRLRRFDGEYRWFDNRGNPHRDDSGAIIAWHVLLTDIDDLKRAEEVVRAREIELRQQTETFPQMLWSATADGNIDYCNERLLEYSGLTADEVTGERWVNLLHPDDRAPTAKIWMRCIATGAPYSVEVRQFRVCDQSYRWVLTLALPLRDARGTIVKWYGSCVDIHDRKQAEEAVRASERHLAQIIETIPQNLFGAGADGLVNYLNPQMREWFGRSDETIMAEEWVHLVHPEDRDITVEAWMSTVAAGTPYHHQVRFIHRSGEYRWCDVRARPLRDKESAILAWHGVVDDIHDRKLAEDALKASEQNLRLIIDTIPALAWSARADGTADFFNRHYLDYVGRSGDELADWQWIDLVHPEDLTIITSAWEKAKETGASGGVEARLRRHDGEYRWFLLQTSPLLGDDGKVAKWYGVNTDIQDRKRVEQDLALRERNLREAHDHLTQAQRLSQTGSFTIDVTADTQVWSDELYRILERDHRRAPSFGEFRALIHADDLAIFDGGFARALTDRADLDMVFRIVTAKGSTKYLHAIAHFVVTEAGPVMIGSVQDISASKNAEHELRRSAYLLESAELISETGSFHWDMTSNKLAWSAQMYRIHEIEEGAELNYLDILRMIHPDDADLISTKTQQSFQGIDNPDSSYRIVMPDGRIKYVDTAYRVINHEDGHVESVGVARDVTQRRQFQDALEKLRSELAHITRVSTLGELAASITHEVNQPLSGIITNASTSLRMLASDPPDISGAIRTAQRTIRDGNRASEVIRRLRGLYRKQDFALEAVDLNEAAQEVIAICAHDLQRRQLVLTAKLDADLPPVIGDRIQLQQVILNLVLNAADAVEDGERKSRKILVDTAGEAGMGRLAVRDTGRGLTEEEIGRIFDAFYTTKAHGMGIGLSVSKSIIERHNGRLWAQPGEDGGAIFAFSIPLERETNVLA